MTPTLLQVSSSRNRPSGAGALPRRVAQALHAPGGPTPPVVAYVRAPWRWNPAKHERRAAVAERLTRR